MSICLTALLGGMLPIPQSGIEQHEQFSMRATAYLEQQGPSLVGSKFELLFSDGSLNIFTADEDAVLSFVNGNDLHSKYKIVGVNEIDGGYATKVILLSHSHEDGLELQQNANLIIDWNLSPQLSISKINVVDCQQLTSERSLFYDDEQSVIDPQLNRSKLAPGLNYWQRHIAVSLGFSTKSDQGIAVADVNGDGLEDLYLPQPAGISNSILLQDQFGRFNDYADEAGLDFLDASRSALFVD
ncbi:MAG: hypothetical protein QGF46_08355, partial [Planctomycetota bacterium]|nr:hypothetical protein [Planctomycetota bacterium]